MGYRVWVLDIQNPKNMTFFRKILNSNLNNLFVLTDRRTFYITKCRYCKYLSNKKRHYVDGVSGLGFMGNQYPKNLGKQNPIFFLFPKSNILTTIFLLFIMIYLNLQMF